jgi:hypothetical protein
VANVISLFSTKECSRFKSDKYFWSCQYAGSVCSRYDYDYISDTMPIVV